MDNDDNLFDDEIDGDEDLLDISLDDLTTDDLEEPAPEKPDEEVIELIDLVEKSDEDIDEDIIDFDDTKPLPANKELIEKLKLAAANNKDNDEPGEIGDAASISRSDLELGDITLETGVPDLKKGMEQEETFDTVDTDTDIDLDISESVSDFDETVDFMDGGFDKSQDSGDAGDNLEDVVDSEGIIEDEDNDLDESLAELVKDDQEVSAEAADNLNEGITKPMDAEDSTDETQRETETEEKSIDIDDKPVEADTGQLNETVIGPLSHKEETPAGLKGEGLTNDQPVEADTGQLNETVIGSLPDKEETSAGLKGEGDINDQPVDEAIQLSDIKLHEEPTHEEEAVESVEDSALIVEDDTDSAEKEKRDDTVGAPLDKREEPSIVSEEKIEEVVTKVVGEVVEKVAREVFTEVAEKIITEAIDDLKRSLEADSE
jgi:hypothetical protein